MAVSSVPGTRVVCDHVSDDRPCTARLLLDGIWPQEQLRVYATERGWACTDDGDLCPSHRSGG